MIRSREAWTSAIGALVVGGLLSATPSEADAFLLVGKGKSPASDGATVVLVREGTHTVLSVQGRTSEKDGEVALLMPVPSSVDAKSLVSKSLSARSIGELAQITGPRVAEVWEADPCDVHPMLGPSDIPGSASPAKTPKQIPDASVPVSQKEDAPLGYTIEVLDGKGADVLSALKAEGFTLSPEIEPVLTGTIDAGMKLLVAKIDLAKVNGALPPLRVDFEARDLVLPTRLLAAGGAHRSLDLYVLAPGARFEANGPVNQAIPTNLDVKSDVRSALPSFYSGLLDKTFEKNPGSVITEYAWRASTCELCAAPLAATSLAAWGTGLLPSAKTGQQGEVMVDAEHVGGPAGGSDELKKSLEDCYAKALTDKPGIGGSVSLAVEVADGKVTSAKPTRSTGLASDAPIDDAVTHCASDSTSAAHLEKSGTLTIGFSPLSRKFMSDLVLTKMHARFDQIPDKDLQLKEARAIEGGRELGSQGLPEKKVYWAQSANDFQARYVIRHPWKAKLKCDTPERGVWVSKNPNGKSDKSGTDDKKAINDVGAAIEGGMPSLDPYVIAASDAPAPPPTPAPSASVAAAPQPSASAAPPVVTPPPKTDAGCSGCATAPSRTHLSAWWALGALALLRLRSKRQAER